MKVRYIFIALAVLYAFVGTIELNDIVAREAEEQLELVGIAGQAIAEYANPLPLSHPLPYRAVVIQSGPGIRAPRARYYFSEE